MNKLGAAKFTFFLSLIALSQCILGCVKKEEAPEKPSGPERGALFSFDYGSIDSLLLVKNDPGSSDHFSARLKKISVTPLKWEIVSDPDSGSLLDRTADDTFIAHLLDTLTTLHVIKKLPENTPAENMGLAPPRFAIGFELPEQKHELLLGQETDNPKGSYAKTDVYSSNFIVDGAAVGMFGYLKSFDVLRKKTVFTFSIDEVDVVHINQKRYERMNTSWIDSQKRINSNLDSFLEALSHLQIQKYIDDVKTNQDLKDKVTSKPDYEFKFEGRKFAQEKMFVKKIGHDLFAFITNRPKGVFQLFSESENHFKLKN